MYKAAKYLLLPLLLINITTAENGWEIFGINFGRTLYWGIIVIAWYVARNSPYRYYMTGFLCIGILLRMLELLCGWGEIELLRKAALAIVFVIAGAVVYGTNPLFLRKQLVIFLALCIPIMLLQILGVSSFFYGWVTDYAHDPKIMATYEIGKFIDIPLYPTLFVGINKLYYLIGQGRPAGLLYANNVLSIFVSITVGLNLAVTRMSRLSFSDVVVLVVVVLTMAKSTYIITALLYVTFFVFNVQGKRLLCFKSIILLTILSALYYWVFPGLFMANFSAEMFWLSMLHRLLDIVYFLDLENLGNFFYEQHRLYGTNFNEDATYSGLSIILKSNFVAPVLFLAVVILVQYVNRLRKMRPLPIMPYVVTLLVCVLTQFGTSYFAAPSFQFIAGLALFPLFKGLWKSKTPVSVK